MSEAAQRIAALRKGRANAATQPYHSLTFNTTGDRAVRDARRMMLDGWKKGEDGPVELHPPVQWHQPQLSRTAQWSLQSLLPLDTLFHAAETAPYGRFWQTAADIALDWVDRHPTGDEAGFAWYDMGVGLRAYRLAHLVNRELSRPTLTDDRLAVIVESIGVHAEALLDEKTYAGHSNHGFFQVAGMLAIATRLPWHEGSDRLEAIGTRRLIAMLDGQFAPDGAHTEHSPYYHLMMLQALNALAESGVVRHERFEEIRQRADDALAWFVMPDGRIAPFGDSFAAPVSNLWKGFKLNRERIAARYSSPGLRHAASAGAMGMAPTERHRVFEQSGYFVAKPTWPRSVDAKGSYMAMQAGFHSRTHKHADDLAILWFDRGRRILEEPGRYAFPGNRPKRLSAAWREGSFYDDPKRRYVESTRAHNTVEVSGVNFDRRRAPYGSALRESGEDGTRFDVTAVAPLKRGTFTRSVTWEPGEWLEVADLVETRAPQRVVQWWHLAPAFEVRRSNAGFVATDGSLTVDIEGEGSAELVGPIVGQEEPTMQGWTSPERATLVPAPALGFATRGRRNTLATRFTIRSE